MGIRESDVSHRRHPLLAGACHRLGRGDVAGSGEQGQQLFDLLAQCRDLAA